MGMTEQTRNMERLCPIELAVEERREPVRGWWSSMRVDGRSLPPGYHVYGVRHNGEEDGDTLERSVVVDHFMDIITDEDLDGELERLEEMVIVEYRFPCRADLVLTVRHL